MEPPNIPRSAARRSHRLLSLLTALTITFAAGCVRTEVAAPSRILADVRAEGLTLEDPIAVSPEAIAEIERQVATVTDHQERLRALRDLLCTKADRP